MNGKMMREGSDATLVPKLVGIRVIGVLLYKKFRNANCAPDSVLLVASIILAAPQ